MRPLRSVEILAHPLWRKMVCNQNGSILVGVIITMVVVATLGTAMVTLTTTSTYTQVGAFDAAKAYYLAEAGGSYAVPIIRQEALSGGDPLEPVTGTIARLNNKTFTMRNGDTFRLALSYLAPNYTLESYGVLRQGANTFEATRKVTFVINASGAQLVPINPVTFDSKSDLQNNLSTISGGAKVAGNKLKVDKNLTELGLSWDGSSTLPDLAEIWADGDGLLGYSIQVKANMNAGIKEFVAGLSFRMNSATNSSYGFSFVKRSGQDSECGSFIPNAFCAKDSFGNFILEGGAIYIVLWKKVGGSYTLLDYRKAQVADGVIGNTGNLKDWSTLVVRVAERYITNANGDYLDENGQVTSDPAARVRENVITAYVQGEDDTDAKAYQYQRVTDNCTCAVADCSCAIHWAYDKFNPVVWSSAGVGAIVDGSLTSAGFATIRPDEVGIHYIGDSGERFFDDFAVNLDGGGAGGGGSGGNSTVRY